MYFVTILVYSIEFNTINSFTNVTKAILNLVYIRKQLFVYICNMKQKQIQYLNNNYTNFKQQKISGRYITLVNIESIINKLPNIFKTEIIGHSFKKQPIYKISIGTGKIKILFWSQMHGNESTGTKALFDLFNFIVNPLALKDLTSKFLKECTLVFIPMLNPDGALKYTRLNAQKIDLNRDAIDLKAAESKLLNKVLYDFKPHYCFNLHDQRTIFSVGTENNPATLSFLAPSVNEERTITKGRKETMQIIVGIDKTLQQLIPNQIGRYTDEFYPTATGDNFQKAGFNTILVEAGHFKDDYQRETTRKYNFIALISGINTIISPIKEKHNRYFDIPENEKNYLDVIYTNIRINDKKGVFGIHFKEKLKDKKIIFAATIKRLNNLLSVNANKTISDSYKFNSLTEFKEYLGK